MNMRSCDWQ